MKKVFKNSLNLGLICFILSLSSCEVEKDVIKKSSSIEKSKSEISFSEFKRETGLRNFKTTIKIDNPNNAFARNADGSYELSDFDLDTDIIKRLELDDKITYSFRIYPKVITSPTSFYNLTMENKEGDWIQNVVELKPTLENFDNLLSGSTNDISGQASLIFTSNENALTLTNNCYSIGIIGNNCASSEISETCVSKKYSTFCFDSENNVTLGAESNIFNGVESTPTDYSFILNTNNLKENLSKFATEHVSISNQIITLLDNENDLNFDNFPYTELNSSPNEEQFKQALANTGMVKYEEIFDLLLLQNQNASEFIATNKDFTSLKPETRNLLITDAINAAVIDNPIKFVPPTEPVNTTLARTCAQQYVIDREDCAEDALINWGILAGGCWFGTPAACAVGGVGVLAIAANCSRRAKRDYASCMSGN